MRIITANGRDPKPNEWPDERIRESVCSISGAPLLEVKKCYLTRLWSTTVASTHCHLLVAHSFTVRESQEALVLRQRQREAAPARQS